MASKIQRDIAKRKGEVFVSSLPKIRDTIRKDFPEYKLVKKVKYAGTPADKTRVSK